MTVVNFLRQGSIFIIFVLSTGCQIVSLSTVRHLERAEEYSRQERLDEAIEEYRAHMEYRLASKEKAKWENPYFYLLLIGDLKLRQGRPIQALEDYQAASEKGIDINLVSDRYRMVGYWYESNGDLQSALELLTKHRELDPMLFNPALDRIAKAIVDKERSRQKQGALPN